MRMGIRGSFQGFCRNSTGYAGLYSWEMSRECKGSGLQGYDKFLSGFRAQGCLVVRDMSSSARLRRQE